MGRVPQPRMATSTLDRISADTPRLRVVPQTEWGMGAHAEELPCDVRERIIEEYKRLLRKRIEMYAKAHYWKRLAMRELEDEWPILEWREDVMTSGYDYRDWFDDGGWKEGEIDRRWPWQPPLSHDEEKRERRWWQLHYGDGYDSDSE